MLDAIAATIIATGVTLGSVHREPGFNGFNPGIYAEARNGLSAGAYLNSSDRLSVWAGLTFHTPQIGAEVRWSAAIVTGAVLGYGKPSPLVLPSIAAQHGDKVMRLSYAPRPRTPNGSDALVLSFELRH
jgi:hypothetical protein